MNGFMDGFIIIIVVAIVVFIILFSMGYRKASPDRGVVISGLGKSSRMLVGRAGFMFPFLEKTDYLYLKQVTVPIVTNQPIPTNDLINVNVEAVFKIQVCIDNKELRAKAMRNFLNKQPEAIIADTTDALLGNLREIVGTMKLEELIKEKDKFSMAITTAAEGDMNELGLKILTCNIQNITDMQGMIDDLGAYHAESIKREAAIQRANAQRDVAIAAAAADKEANDARVLAALEIEQKNNELSIRQAELKKTADTKQAEADAAFQIQAEEQRKTIETQSVNADIARREREAELAMKEVEVQKRRLEAEVREKAEADRFRRQQEADAELYERQKDAEAKRVAAEAARFEEEQRAEAVRVAGLAEAEAIAAKGKAEAEAILKKAEAMKQFGEAAITEMLVNVLPEVAKQVAAPLASIDEVHIFGGDANGISGMSNNVPIVMAQAIETMKAATGIDLRDVMRAHTLEAKTNRNINLSEPLVNLTAPVAGSGQDEEQEVVAESILE